MTDTTPLLPDPVRERLAAIEDPEMGLSIVELGLVYGFEAEDERVTLTMTLTSPTCPMGGLITDAVHDALSALYPGRHIEVNVVFDPPWTPERMAHDL
ncbi:metal-sulfur cluster assembly factor [Hahella sp. SMD15-11]|uniref:Metal-sulfur cluster assembly factor n=1 Tax=Thermohahella caldifontis TaxID=3142973 RepID=A0AB39V0N0_9GAMM